MARGTSTYPDDKKSAATSEEGIDRRGEGREPLSRPTSHRAQWIRRPYAYFGIKTDDTNWKIGRAKAGGGNPGEGDSAGTGFGLLKVKKLVKAFQKEGSEGGGNRGKRKPRGGRLLGRSQRQGRRTCDKNARGNHLGTKGPEAPAVLSRAGTLNRHTKASGGPDGVPH